MNKKSNTENFQPDFETKYLEFSDSEIYNILIKRSHYQKAAAEAAIKEAIKRGLINSEQDLLAEEFRERPFRFSLFPSIENAEIKVKTRKSVARSLLIVGSVPAVWGGYKIYQNEIGEGVILLLLGSIWMFFSFQLMKKANNKMINLLGLMLFAATVYLSNLFFSVSSVSIVDVFFASISCLLILYGLLYYRRLS